MTSKTGNLKESNMSAVSDTNSACQVAFLLTPNFPSFYLTTATSLLEAANRLLKKEKFTWKTLSLDGGNVPSDGGFTIACDAPLKLETQFDALLVITSLEQFKYDQSQLELLNAWTDRGISWALLTHYATPEITGCQNLRDSNLSLLSSCSPQWLKDNQWLNDINTADSARNPANLVLSLIAKHTSNHLALDVLGQIKNKLDVCSLYTAAKQKFSKTSLREQLSNQQPKLAESITLMENNLEEPLNLNDLANYINLSRRQLERLFQKHLNCSPSRFYLKLRLAKAQTLLRETQHPIVTIANECGFVSMPHFSKVYREYIGMAPREERRAKSIQSFKARAPKVETRSLYRANP